jgi:ribosome-binding protein aMBF1 (putative translation factor)
MATHIGRRIERARKRIGLSREKLALEFGTSAQNVRYWEKCLTMPGNRLRPKVEKWLAEHEGVVS